MIFHIQAGVGEEGYSELANCFLCMLHCIIVWDAFIHSDIQAHYKNLLYEAQRN